MANFSNKFSFVFTAILLSGITVIINGYSTESKTGITVLPAHSHNDYDHARPLLDALDNHFKSIEADIFTVGDSIFVAHDYEDIRPGRTLQQLYLDPLRERIAGNNGSVYGNGEEIILLIDIKDDGLKTYQLLHEILTSYKDILTSFTTNEKNQGSIMVVISGNRPVEFMQSQPLRLAGYDGRMEQLESGISPALMPMVSDNWTKHFTWDGNGPMPDEERTKLRDIAEKAKAGGYILRFWATPNRTAEQRQSVWTELQNAGTGLIGVDELQELKDFLVNSPESK
jgi:hypothetical protein